MGPSEDMEIDRTDQHVGPPLMNIWCMCGSNVNRIKAEVPAQVSLRSLKELLCSKIDVSTITPENIDVIYNGGRLKDDAAVKTANFKHLNVITVIRRMRTGSENSTGSASSGKTTNPISQVAVALRTAFLNPNFVPTIQGLGESDKLENILAILPPELKDDPIGLAIIQDPVLMFRLSSDMESLKKIAQTRPWVIEAFIYLAGSVHLEKGAKMEGRPRIPMFGGSAILDEDDMDDEPLGGEAAGPSNRITREQLSAALNSLTALGHASSTSAPPANPFIPPSTSAPQAPSSFLDMLQQAASNSTGNQVPGQLSGQGANPQPPVGGPMAQVTPEMVAQAMNMALNTLPPDERERGYNTIREEISRIRGADTSNAPGVTTGVSQSSISSTQQNTSSGRTRDRFQSQLHQMREMGIQDERLSLLALRLSEGDVATAVELIFSGWTGEGAEAPLSDEE